MKNKTLKKTLLISTGLLAAGGICIGIGIAMGGSPVFYLDNEGIHLKETTACPETVQDYAGQKQLAAFEKIEVDLKSGEFSLEEAILIVLNIFWQAIGKNRCARWRMENS